MHQQKPFRLSNSITDFSPLFLNLEFLFKRLKATGIDGVEIVLGIKSRWNAKEVLSLSQKYELPIVSLHQPPWSGIGLWFDEDFMNLAKLFGVNQITCHPLLGFSFADPQMQQYLKRFSGLQEKYHVEILIENLEKNLLGFKTDTSDIDRLIEIVKKYNLKITLDIDHLKSKSPPKEPWFPRLLPYLGNIHLSSFTKNQKHMPLYLGDFEAKEFIRALYQVNYQGLLTFELQYPRLLTLVNYDFDMLRKSVDIVKSV